jgi:hypothetical protein
MNNTMLTYTVSIPAPALSGELEYLAQIQVSGDKLVDVHWMRSTRQAVCNYDGKWYIQSDQNMLTAIARLINYEKPIDLLTVDGLFIFETPGHGRAANDDLVRAFRDCEWSDYASDRMAFQCVIREKNLFEKNLLDQQAYDMARNNRMKCNIPVDNSTSVPMPVLTRATECCCTGCCKVVDKNIVDKNKKY